MIDERCTLSWRGFHARVLKAASVLHGQGVGPGERYAILAANSVRYAELLHAGYCLGAVPVPLNHRLAPLEIAAILDDASCRLLIAEPGFAQLLVAPELAAWRGRAMRLDPVADADAPLDYEIEMARALPIDTLGPQEDEDALLLYTGGTTSRGKGVRLTHRSLATVALQNAAALVPRSDDLYLHVAPMFHSADLLGNAFMACGAAHAYLAKPSAGTLLEAIARLRVSAVVVPPALLIPALQDEAFERSDLASLRILVVGSAPMAERWFMAARDALPSLALWHGYGLTETAQMLTLGRVPRDDEIDAGVPVARVRSCGRPLIGTDLRVVDDSGSELPPGAAGNVLVRGPQLFQGYLGLPQETAHAFRGGWLHTGDVGTLDADGFLYLLDRKKDMVITGGENVYCFEVEEVLARHPDVAEAAVFGVPDEIWGEALCAALVARADACPSPDALIEHCRRFIGGYKIPRRIVLIPELPRSSLGKVQKDELRRRHAATPRS